MNRKISPSLLSADFGNLKKEIEMINQSEADWLHLDIMDGVFVPNISFGFPIVKIVKELCQKPLDTHLMIVEPDKFIDRFADLGIELLNVHYEACIHLNRTIQRIKSKGMKAAVTLNPHTPIGLLEDILPELDMVLIMSVNPGFAGQTFIENSYKKITDLKELILKKNCSTLIEVDGGVNTTNANKLFECGADVLVAGQYIFGSNNPMQTIKELKNS